MVASDALRTRAMFLAPIPRDTILRLDALVAPPIAATAAAGATDRSHRMFL